MANHQQGTLIGGKRLHQPVHRGHIEVVGGLVQNQQLRCRAGQKDGSQGHPESLPAGENTHGQVHPFPAEEQPGQIIADLLLGQRRVGCHDQLQHALVLGECQPLGQVTGVRYPVVAGVAGGFSSLRITHDGPQQCALT